MRCSSYRPVVFGNFCTLEDNEKVLGYLQTVQDTGCLQTVKY
jgi:hypothetical protein